jgi:hypothetical protein
MIVERTKNSILLVKSASHLSIFPSDSWGAGKCWPRRLAAPSSPGPHLRYFSSYFFARFLYAITGRFRLHSVQGFMYQSKNHPPPPPSKMIFCPSRNTLIYSSRTLFGFFPLLHLIYFLNFNFPFFFFRFSFSRHIFLFTLFYLFIFFPPNYIGWYFFPRGGDMGCDIRKALKRVLLDMSRLEDGPPFFALALSLYWLNLSDLHRTLLKIRKRCQPLRIRD